jgi:hypothetical protein
MGENTRMSKSPKTVANTPIPNYTPWFLAILFATFVITIVNRVLILFWPRWIAIGVSFLLGFAPAWYFVLRQHYGTRGALERGLIWAALGGGFVAMTWYVFP